MKYINDYHQQLTESQHSGLMSFIAKLSFDKRIAISTSALVIAITASAMAWQGTSSARIYFCIKSPAGEICSDKNNRPFRMTPHHWHQWGLDGRSKYVVMKKLELPTNPGKPIQLVWGFIGFAVAGWMFRQLQHDENLKSKLDAVAEERDKAIALLNNQIDLMEAARDVELSATDNAVIIQQAELLGEIEVRLTQMEASAILFDAETAGMTEEQRNAYVEFVRNQQTPYLTGSQTLGKTVDPKDKVKGQESKSITGDWITHAIDYFCVLVWGGQDGGKTTAASHIIKGRKDRGDRVIILDPHAAKGQWEGLEVIGAGMNYEAIDNFMGWYFKECQRRYQLLRSEGQAAVKKLGNICLVAEELTNYASRCKNSAEFIRACLSDNRKIFFNCLFISHGRTLATMGEAKGLAKTRDDSFLEIHCIPPTGGNPRVWEVKYPGGDFAAVPVPQWETIFDFGADNPPAAPFERDKLEEIYKLEFNLEPPEPKSEPLNQRTDNNSSQNLNQFYTPLKLTREQILQLINSLSAELNQTEIIERLWQCRKGGSAAWREAYAQFKELTDS